MDKLWQWIFFSALSGFLIYYIYLFAIGWGHRGKNKFINPKKANVFDRVMFFILIIGGLIIEVLLVSVLIK